MSKAAKQSIIILIVMLIAAFAFAGLTLFQKTSLEKTKIALEKKIEEYQGREKKYVLDNKQLEDNINALTQSKGELEERLSNFDVNLDDLHNKIRKLSLERDDWRGRVESLRGEREGLMKKLEEKPKTEIVYKYIEKEPEGKSEETKLPPTLQAKDFSLDVNEESYWAQVLKGKAALELKLENLSRNLSDNSVEIVELNKQNTDLQLELSKITNEKEAIEREIKYGHDLSDSLALDLARAQNDKKFLGDRIEKINTENETLRTQIKQLTSTKIALEKSIVRLQDEKKTVEKKLVETENIIQGRIDEIWEIKDSLEENFKPAQTLGMDTSEIELPPIVVSAQGRYPVANPSVDTTVGKTPGFDGNIVSINEENNFVIVDMGEDIGIKLGDNLSVYRGAEFVAGLEVIQVRKDIAAADIKNMITKIQVGDTVR